MSESQELSEDDLEVFARLSRILLERYREGHGEDRDVVIAKDLLSRALSTYLPFKQERSCRTCDYCSTFDHRHHCTKFGNRVIPETFVVEGCDEWLDGIPF